MNAILRSIGCIAVLATSVACAPSIAAPGDPPAVRAATPSGAELGLRIEESADRRVLRVAAIEPESLAARAGLEIGDVVVALDGRTMGSGHDVEDYLAGVAPGRRVRFDVERRGRAERLFIVVDAAAVVGGDGVRRVATPALAPLGTLGGTAAAPADGLHGVRLVSLSPGLGRYFGAARGVLVVQAARGNPLQLEDGDVIQSVDGQATADVDAALDLLAAVDTDGRALLEVLRDGRARNIEVTLPAAAPPTARRRQSDPSPRPARGD